MSKPRKTDYVIGDEAEGGAKIGAILGSSPNFIAFLTPNGALRWEIDDSNVPLHFSSCLERFDAVQSMIDASVPRKVTKRDLRKSLGIALYGSVLSADADRAAKHFEAIIRRVEAAVSLHARVFYVASSLAAASAMIAALAAAWVAGRTVGLESYVLSGGAGCCGAAISVLLRSSTIDIPLHSTPLEHFFSGVSRTVLGLLSGVALACVVNGNLLLGIAASSLPAMSALGLVAGFSERYLPRVLTALEERSLAGDEKQTGA